MGTSPDIDWNKLEAALTKMEAVRAKLDRTTRERDGSQVLPQALTLMSQFTSLGATAVKLLGVPGGVDRVLREVARDLKETADITWTTPWEFLKMTPQLWGGIHSFVDMLRDNIRFTLDHARAHSYGNTCRNVSFLFSGIRMWVLHLNLAAGVASELLRVAEVVHGAGDVDPYKPSAARVAFRFLHESLDTTRGTD